MRLIYNFFIQLYGIAIWIHSFANSKSKLWVDGRNNWHVNLEKIIPRNKKIVWMHCASLGEFEQGRTVIEQLKKNNLEVFILLTFFSPSGYEIRKNYEHANAVFYLPLDTASNAKKFIEIVNPTIAVFVKYEFWFNYIIELNANKIPIVSISAIFRNSQYFFKWYGAWFLNQLKTFQMFFVQNKSSKKTLELMMFNNIIVSGDTRFDRVFEISKSNSKNKLIDTFSNNSFVIIAGSTWDKDETILKNYFEKNCHQNIKLIIAPHNVDKKNIQRIVADWKNLNPILFTQANVEQCKKNSVIIVDCIGMLMQLYKYGNLAYIGGGFGKGIHNILEPATFGLPMAFGPNHTKFNEALELIALKAATVVENENDFEQFVNLKSNPFLLKNKSETLFNYIADNVGATQTIVSYLLNYL